MFRSNSDFIPRTYSVKSYKRRESFKIKKLFKYLTYIIVLVAALGITFLSVAHLV